MTFASAAGPAKSVLLIFNPTAGRRRRGLVDEVVRLVRALGWTVDVMETAASGDARRLAETCDAGRYGVIAVAGGDGTINEVVNGLAARAATAPPLALVPLGTANVLAHELGLGSTASALAEAITDGREILMHPGRASGSGLARCFSLMAGAGFDAKVVAGVSAPLKRRWGKIAYVWRSLIEARRYRPVRYAVEIDGVAHEAASVIVTHARHYAGPYVVAPEASLDDPLLHVCLFERWGWMHALRFGAALLLDALPRTPGYHVVAGREVRISVLNDAGERRRQPVQIDGDDALTLPVSIRLSTEAVRLLKPA
ncbi:diacylglycerol kinase family protein [Reyranella sp.]|uniref:diacylglycerol/lipid kinase family protein n=1 Tax=Reyranella sp. TaxID=1929291 RepID=UPI0025E84A11|nr:diacylglycerol kinase family protein [Reyranella sp.]